jgi:Cu/Ag efflux pump CusA
VFSDLKARQSANTRSLLYSLAVAAGIFLLLQAAFRSWSRAALLFLTLPLAAAGGLVAALLTDRLLTMGALLGFVVVLSLALRNGMLLIRRLQRLEQREDNALQGTDLVLRAAREEAFPVVTTAVAVGMEILAPLCVVACGGLVTSTLYTLFVLPALYLRLVARTSRTA